MRSAPQFVREGRADPRLGEQIDSNYSNKEQGFKGWRVGIVI